MNTPQYYIPNDREDAMYSNWLSLGLFESTPDERTPFTVVIPPPNVTGVLHMGHTLNNTIQDIAIRRARMRGYNACWVPGTDHASIATEAKVVQLLAKQGLNKFELGREKFLEHAFEWKEKYGGIILEQLKKLGASCDWSRTAFTMDEIRYDGVIDVFVRLYEKGLIYRGTRMVNWDPKAKTAVSDEEVNHVESTDKLYYVKYAVAGADDEWVTIATTRPETIMADAAVCINPNDERFTHLHGKKVIIPIVDREVPIILDDYVDMEFGTGCLKITPAHDVNDFEIGQRHNLPIIDLLNEDGTLNKKATVFVGEDREIARVKTAELLAEKGLLVKTEDITHNVGTSERSGAVIEPRLSMQWFCKMEEMAKPALEAVQTDEIQFHPPKFKNMYRHWMENIKDWCISRQLWWGHRIPAWYLPNGEIVVAKTAEEALAKAQEKDPKLGMTDLEQDDDVLDTWFSSWLWPLSVFNGIAEPENEEIKYYYPTDVLVTAPEIIFFWVARMIMAGQEYRQVIPFKNVYFTGIVRDEIGRKMSKQFGNSPDLFKLIEKHGADGVRFGTLISSPAGNDLLFDVKLCEQGSAFINKIWNGFKLIETWHGFEKIVDDAPAHIVAKNQQAAALFKSKISKVYAEIEQSHENYRMSDALQSLYRLIWNDFCSNYLEWVKPKKDTVIDRAAYEQTITFFEDCMKLLHPFMPFITEEIYHLLRDRDAKESICVATYPSYEKASEKDLEAYSELDQLITAVRAYKTKEKIALKDGIVCQIVTQNTELFQNSAELVIALSGIESYELVSTAPEGKKSFLSGATSLYDMNSSNEISEEERTALEAEVKRLQGFLKGIDKKLSNERFVNGAPAEVIERERKKKTDAEQKIETLSAKLV